MVVEVDGSGGFGEMVVVVLWGGGGGRNSGVSYDDKKLKFQNVNGLRL